MERWNISAKLLFARLKCRLKVSLINKKNVIMLRRGQTVVIHSYPNDQAVFSTSGNNIPCTSRDITHLAGTKIFPEVRN